MVRKRASGFTLVELVVVMAIVAILAAIAYPSYRNYVQRARRADAKEMLQRVAAAEERFYTNRNQYTNDLITAAGLNLGTANSEGGHYAITIVVPAGNQSYTLTATPGGAQSSDKCANLTLTNTGAKGYSGNQNNGSCW